MRSILGPAGIEVARARIPVKLLAVRTGLAQYGRNNIAYVRNMGSLVRLDAFCTDAPLRTRGLPDQGELALELLPALSQLPPRVSDRLHPLRRHGHRRRAVASPISTSTRGSGPTGSTPRATTPWWAACVVRSSARRTGSICASPRSSPNSTATRPSGYCGTFRPSKLPAGVRAKLAALDLEDYSTVLGRNLRALVRAGACG